MNQRLERLADYLGHIVTATGRVQRYVKGKDEATFFGDEFLQDAVLRNLEVIGEASRNIETRFPEFAGLHPELPFAAAYQMRNAVAHGYHKVDLAIVWRTVVDELPRFETLVLSALAGLEMKP